MVQPGKTMFGVPGSPLPLQKRQGFVKSMMMKDGEQWGMMIPELSLTSPHTGCPTYLTPQRYWPKDLQHRYFGNRTIFGMLRDPYERLAAIFRGNVNEEYGGQFPQFIEKCDLN